MDQDVRRTIRRGARIAATALPATMLVAVLAGCLPRDGLLAPAGGVAMRQADHMATILMWMLPVVVPVFVALPLVLWRGRLGGRGRYTPDWTFSGPLELAIWGVPAVIVAVLGWNLWVETFRMDPYAPLGPDPVEVSAVGYASTWLFLYPGGPASAGLLVLPADRAARLRLTSAGVLRSLSVPRVAGQVYAMPGMATELNLATGEPGRFTGRNTQYDGPGFAAQRFELRVLPQPEFDAWLAEARGGPVLDAAALDAFARPGPPVAPRTWGYAEVDPFAAVLGQAHRGGN